MAAIATRNKKKNSKKLKDHKDEVTKITKKISEEKPTDELMQQLGESIGDIEIVVQSTEEGTIDNNDDLVAIINSFKTALHEMRKHIATQDADIDELRSENALLTAKIATLTERVTKLEELLTTSRIEAATSKKEIATLTKKVAALNDDVKELKQINIDLLLGQIASKVSQSMVEWVIKRSGVVYKKKYYITINWLREILKDPSSNDNDIFQDDKQIQTASTHLKELEQKFPLTASAYRAMDEFRKVRNSTAHLDGMTVQEACSLIEANSVSIEETDKEIGLMLLDILKYMRITDISTKKKQ